MLYSPAVIVYATKYGSTREYAELLASRVGVPAARVEEVDGDSLAAADWLVLGAPVYGHGVLPAMERFCHWFRDLLVARPLAAFVVCGDTLWIPRAGEGGGANLAKLTRLLPREPFATALLGGRMRMEELDGEDRPRILAFYRRLGKEPVGYDRTDLAAAARFAAEVGRLTGKQQKTPCPENDPRPF